MAYGYLQYPGWEDTELHGGEHAAQEDCFGRPTVYQMVQEASGEEMMLQQVIFILTAK